ncbi:MAG: metalloregulator ArsR/SmtB family transcription factor [Alphaproteobacteria bacterium]|nr:metalloregulator ArsR/SmtB family transcription factor [Alphaproteobacteria bacterium]
MTDLTQRIRPARLAPDAALAALRAAAEPTRLRILALCHGRELTVSDLCQILGQSQPRVSRHLKLLCDAGLMARFPEGAFAFFRLTDATLPAPLLRPVLDAIDPTDAVYARDAARLKALNASRAEAAAAYFLANAGEWDRIRSLHVDEGVVERALLDLLPAEPVENLLDIGTGTGRMLLLLGERVRRGVGVDASREMLALARANLESAKLNHLSVRQGDMYQLPWPDPSFDLVVIHMVLHFADDPAAAVAEAARVLRPDGRIVIADFAPHALEELRRDYAHRRLGFADDEVAGWFCSAGLARLEPRRLAGKPLTVVLWAASRRHAPSRGSRAARQKEPA